MTEGFKVDLSDAFAGLDALGQAAKEHLPRSMAVAGGQLLRDEAKLRAPVYDGASALASGDTVKNPRTPGQLRDAIYLAYSESRSIPQIGQATYSVSWNAAKAPHGHLLEFGHWRINKLVKGKDGWHPTTERLPSPKWVSAIPFLRPAYEARGQDVIAAMMERGRVRLAEIMANPELLKGSANES